MTELIKIIRKNILKVSMTFKKKHYDEEKRTETTK